MSSSVMSFQQKMNLLKKDIALRKERATRFCSPTLYKEFTPDCVIIWKSIYNDENYLKTECAKKKIEL